MNEKKKERIQTIILLCLVFFAINYSLYSFVVVPWKDAIQMKKAEHLQNVQNVDFENTLNDRIAVLQNEVDGLNKETADYDNMVLEQFDTLNVCYDFYQYFQKHNIDGKSIQFIGLEENTSSGSSTTTEGTVETGTADEDSGNVEEPTAESPLPTMIPAETPPLTVENNESEPYQVIGVNLTLVVKKSLYYDLLKDLENISKQKLFVNHVGITTLSGTTGELGTTDEDLSMIVHYNAYVQLEAGMNAQPVSYTFYQDEEGVENMEDIFSTGPEAP